MKRQCDQAPVSFVNPAMLVRVFVRLREMLASHKEPANKMQELERIQKEQFDQIANIYQMIENMILPPELPSHWFRYG